jgi:hypothetical protein
MSTSHIFGSWVVDACRLLRSVCIRISISISYCLIVIALELISRFEVTPVLTYVPPKSKSSNQSCDRDVKCATCLEA